MQCVYVFVIQYCSTLCNPMDRSTPGFSVHGILQWAAIPSSKRSSWPRDWTWVSCIAGGFFTIWASREAHCEGCTLSQVMEWYSKAVCATVRGISPKKIQNSQHSRRLGIFQWLYWRWEPTGLSAPHYMLPCPQSFSEKAHELLLPNINVTKSFSLAASASMQCYTFVTNVYCLALT